MVCNQSMYVMTNQLRTNNTVFKVNTFFTLRKLPAISIIMVLTFLVTILVQYMYRSNYCVLITSHSLNSPPHPRTHTHSTHAPSQILREYQSVGADLNVMPFCTQFIPMDVIDSPTNGSIIYHPSILPKHRGASAINW